MIIALLISLFLLLGMPMMGQMMPINLPADGDWPTIVGDSIMLIGPRQNELTEEQRYFNPPYLLIYPGKEHLKNDMIRAALCDCDPSLPNRRIGVFSVAPDKQVSFSQGNLQYLPAANIWKFADTQYEYLGNANKYLSPTFRNWVDLFGWSADNTTAPFGVSTSTNDADYTGEFVDWGTNTICGEAANTWRTLSRDEWEYLLNGRDNASQLRFRAQVNNVNGFVFLPDQWLCPEGIELNIEQLTTQVFTLDAWSKMENAGAVFLPAAGRLNDKQLVNFDDHGNYWSSTRIDNTNVDYFAFTFSTNKLHVDHQSPIHFARSVRLVHDTVLPEAVDLGLSVKWATFNVGATSPEEFGDHFAWGETEPKDTYSWATYKWCQGTANTFTKYCSNSQYGNADYKTTLDPEDDAAIVHLGGNWRMPTIEEWMELKQNCTWKKITINGMTGYQVTAKNGNSIFLPRAGLRMSNILYAADSVGYYASRNHLPEFSHEDYASYMLMYDNNISKSSAVRYYGLPIRPVYDDIPDPCLVVKVNDTLSINMMCVEGGTFRMGVGAENYIERDDPQANKDSTTHLVTLSDYYMAETAVTQGLWKAVMGTDINDMVAQSPDPSSKPKVGDTHPMMFIRLRDALSFIEKLNAMTGLHFRLPTEAEWEYAARGGQKSKGYRYPGSNDHSKVASAAGAPVAQKMPNELGIYDMSGCTREMCADIWRTTYIYDEHVVNPVGPIQSYGNRVMRGGQIHGISHPYTRYPYTPAWCGMSLGFRLVLPTETRRQMIHVNNSYFEMVYVGGGTFMMGSDAPDAEADEKPVHEVTLSDYYIGQTEVTQHLWNAVMGSNPSTVNGNNLPVTDISWNDAQLFVQKLSELTGLHFRLPTEAEWEYAARGGQKSEGYLYAGSNDINEVGWYAGNSGNKLHAVGGKLPNELGIFDMTGNAWEWCYDWHTPYTDQAQTNPTGAATGEKHVLRGGCYHYDSKNSTNTNRHSYYTPDKGGASTGLRIVLEVDK